MGAGTCRKLLNFRHVNRHSEDPNITGWFTLGRNSGHVSKVDGTLFYFGEADRSAAATADANDAQHAVFDPSRANATYGSSSVVQPASSRFLACIKS
nr:MAG TPA: hypothetical protein [Caudoviricetes sp.]